MSRKKIRGAKTKSTPSQSTRTKSLMPRSGVGVRGIRELTGTVAGGPAGARAPAPVVALGAGVGVRAFVGSAGSAGQQGPLSVHTPAEPPGMSASVHHFAVHWWPL